jgi:RNA polymerase sigma factor (TIGR02999 family)
VVKTASDPTWDPAPSVDQLVPVLFDELRAMARSKVAREHRNVTFQTTDLVHEAYLRLAGDARAAQRGRAYFFAAAARAMRQVLVDAARRRNAARRGSGAVAVSLDENVCRVDAYGDHLLDLDAALRELEQRYPRHARTVECRFFGGMTVEETASALGVSPRTVKADWAFARAWLYDALRSESA